MKIPTMKPILLLVSAYLLTFLSCFGADSAEPLAEIASHVLKDGKDGSVNPGFGAILGISGGQSPVRVKRLTNITKEATNVFNVSVEDKRTIILSVRTSKLSTFYLTDLSGKLKKAFVNDGSIANAGLTNIPVALAEAKFRNEKEWWVRYGKDVR